jgi:hypothetical protein
VFSSIHFIVYGMTILITEAWNHRVEWELNMYIPPATSAVVTEYRSRWNPLTLALHKAESMYRIIKRGTIIPPVVHEVETIFSEASGDRNTPKFQFYILYYKHGIISSLIELCTKRREKNYAVITPSLLCSSTLSASRHLNITSLGNRVEITHRFLQRKN